MVQNSDFHGFPLVPVCQKVRFVAVLDTVFSKMSRNAINPLFSVKYTVFSKMTRLLRTLLLTGDKLIVNAGISDVNAGLCGLVPVMRVSTSNAG